MIKASRTLSCSLDVCSSCALSGGGEAPGLRARASDLRDASGAPASSVRATWAGFEGFSPRGARSHASVPKRARPSGSSDCLGAASKLLRAEPIRLPAAIHGRTMSSSESTSSKRIGGRALCSSKAAAVSLRAVASAASLVSSSVNIGSSSHLSCFLHALPNFGSVTT
eukprot:6183936-Pleurochrysis_carterae.AAC.6